jgi:large subunit ribosomal protein L6
MTQSVPSTIHIDQVDGVLNVRRDSDEPNVRALHGLIRSLVANMVTGVTSGWNRTLVINGVGYRATRMAPIFGWQSGIHTPSISRLQRA